MGIAEEKTMNKPKYREELFERIFLWMGIGFLALGSLAFVGVLKPTAYSEVQESNLPGAVFLAFGAAFLMDGQCWDSWSPERRSYTMSCL